MLLRAHLTFALVLSASRLAFSAPDRSGPGFGDHRCSHGIVNHVHGDHFGGSLFLDPHAGPHSHGSGSAPAHSGHGHHAGPHGHAFGLGEGVPHGPGRPGHSPIVFDDGPPGLHGFPGTAPGGFGDNQAAGSGFAENQRPGHDFVGEPAHHNHGTTTPGGGPHRGTGSDRPNPQRPRRPSDEGSGNARPGSNQQNRPKRRLLPDGNCGAEITDKIIGGDDAKLDEFPWMALLRFGTKGGQDRGFGCGGSLISDRYVVTAAHCIKGASLPSNVVVKTVRLGEYDVTRDRDCVNGVCSPAPVDAAVEEITVHPEYRPNDRAQQHDIALIRLRRKVSFNAYVSPICLPFESSRRKDYAGEQMVVAGWGKTSNGVNGTSSAVKQKVSLPYVPLDDCKTFYRGINIRLKNTQMCAGGEKAKDSCQGDSGGPLMSNEAANGQVAWFLTGVVSFGPEDCGVQNVAGVYTKVSEYVDWILDTMRE